MPIKQKEKKMTLIDKKEDPRNCKTFKILSQHKRYYANKKQAMHVYQKNNRTTSTRTQKMLINHRAIPIITPIIKKCYKNKTYLHILFIDFKQAFNSLEK